MYSFGHPPARLCLFVLFVSLFLFSGCSKFVTDEGLAALAATCGKSLRHIALDGCLLLTQQGLCAFLAQAPALETLSLSSLPFVKYVRNVSLRLCVCVAI